MVDETPAFRFRRAPGDEIDTLWQQQYHEWATTTMGVQPRRITFCKYLSREHMAQLTGVLDANAWASAGNFEVHTIFPRDNHEVVHLYSSEWGSPVALFSEGLAVAFQVDPARGDFNPRWGSSTVHAAVRALRRQGTWVPLASLLTTSEFRAAANDVAYAEAGSFVYWLITIDGLAPVKQVFAGAHANDSAAAVQQAFSGAFGVSIETAEANWLAAIDRVDGAAVTTSARKDSRVIPAARTPRPSFPRKRRSCRRRRRSPRTAGR